MVSCIEELVELLACMEEKLPPLLFEIYYIVWLFYFFKYFFRILLGSIVICGPALFWERHVRTDYYLLTLLGIVRRASLVSTFLSFWFPRSCSDLW